MAAALYPRFRFAGRVVYSVNEAHSRRLMSDVLKLDAPSVQEIDAIAAMTDAAVRNVWITWSYYRLNQAMVEITGRADLSWCGFAVWASKTAGRFIRQEEVDPLIQEWITRATAKAGEPTMVVARLLGFHFDKPAVGAPPSGHFSIWRFAAKVLADVGGEIGGGNQDVFHHIAPPFARLIELWQTRGGTLRPEDRAAFLASLDDPADPQREFLTKAFAAMFDAVAEQNPRRRAQLMLQANALVGCAEQTRVQPFIVKSMNAPIEDLFDAKLGMHLRDRFLRSIAWVLHWWLGRLAPALDAEFDMISTRLMMTLNVPGASLHLGQPVPPLPDGQMYPAALTTLDTPDPEALVASLKAADAALSAASDWVNYDQRMKYIAVLFRSRQQSSGLWDVPFTKAQIEQLKAGKLPQGQL